MESENQFTIMNLWARRLPPGPAVLHTVRLNVPRNSELPVSADINVTHY